MARSCKKSTVRLVRPPDSVQAGVFEVCQGKKISFYLFQEIPCDIGGKGFAVHRLERGPLYHVRIGIPDECSCECMGFLRHGRCKHILSLLELSRLVGVRATDSKS